ncbi:MAG: HAMP domain-containing sensor histidine kinase [Acidimicrobiales bacterium]|jgi:signal transduction histidine kinase|nr:HAMP domain-containing sensor histidine kinase [Acidimicrobiales bacterium]
MRRRLGIALVGMVTASLLLAGLGAIILTSVADRANDEEELREQTDAMRNLAREVTLERADSTENAAAQLLRVTRSLNLGGIGLIIYSPNGTQIGGTFPDGVTADDLDEETLRSGGVDSGQKDGLIWAAAAARAGTTDRLVVLTREPDPTIQPAFRWFLLASAVTLLAAVLVTIRLSRRLVDPIREASETATAIAAGDMSARIDDRHAKAGVELADLVGSVNTMAGNLERSRALERQFLLSVSHDLRTPLTNIRGYAEALTDGAADNPVAVGEIIESESRRLERLVGDLLLLARLEGTGFAYNIAPLDIALIAEETVDGLRQEASDRGVELRIRRPDGSVRAEVDHDRFGQVVANLVGNALKFADAEVGIMLWFAEEKIHLAVSDDGPGISESDLPHVFERLYVSQQNPKVKESGSGLGLAIVRELVDGMGGTVMARRATGGGAEFVVSFPPTER